MSKYSTNSVGYALKFEGPADAAEYDTKAGKVGACVEDACDNTIYRSTLPEWQEAFEPKLTELTGVKRGVDQKATDAARARSKNPDKVKDVPEKFKAFNLRARAAFFVDESGAALDEKSDAYKAKDKELDALAQSVADTITIDPSPSARAAAPSKANLAKADDILAREEAKREATIANLLSVVSDYELERDEAGLPDRDSLARLVGKFVEQGI